MGQALGMGQKYVEIATLPVPFQGVWTRAKKEKSGGYLARKREVLKEFVCVCFEL